MRVVIIVQARMTSTRLPGKVLKTVLGKPLLEYQIERLRRVRLADEIVIATTVNETDRPIVDLCQHLSVAYFQGSEEDVLARYYGAAKLHDAEVVVRVTSDCPLIDPEVIDHLITIYLQNLTLYDYFVTDEVTYPRGMDTEIFSMNVLEDAYQEADLPEQREHVTPFIYQQPSRYRLAAATAVCSFGRYRLTVDTPEDFELVSLILQSLYPRNPKFGLEAIVDLLQQQPELAIINAHIHQKHLEGVEV